MTFPPGHYPPLSILDLAPITVGHSIGQALRNTRLLAQEAEALGYKRFWLAEHHNAAAFASSATTVLMTYVAEGTSTIRIGAGGMMLANHAPLQIAEQFGTLESLYPGRIDLGVGRGAGADRLAAAQLQRHEAGSAAEPALSPFDALLGFFQAAPPGQQVRAVPGAGLPLPVWVLGTSQGSAEFAGSRGLPFAYAGHLHAGQAASSLSAYRRSFRPASADARPYALLSLNVIAADSDCLAASLASSRERRLLDLLRGRPLPLQAPGTFAAPACGASERAAFDAALGLTIQGGKACVRARFDELMADCAPDEVLINTEVYDLRARIRSYAIVAEALGHA